MSRIEDLIAEMCPDGVKFRSLSELLNYEQPGKYLVESTSYNDTYEVPVLTAGKTFVLGYTNEVEGIYPAGTTTPVIIFDDFTTAFKWVDFPFKAKSSAMKMLTPKPVAEATARYVYYAMQTIRYSPQDHARQWIATYSNFTIPVPPLPVQNEIVKVLDQFTDLQAALGSELKKRRLQYALYRDSLLGFPPSIRRASIGELGSIFGGLTGKSKADFANGNARFISYVNVFRNIAVDVRADDFVCVGPNEKQRTLNRGDIVFTGSSESADEVGFSSVVTAEVTEPLYLNSFCIAFRPTDPDLIDPDFAKHLFRSGPMRRQIVRTASGVTRFNVSKARLAKVEVPIPPKDEQRRIAALLDDFEALVNSLSIGLPAELLARRRQYEHYRDRLLTFKELPA